MADLIVNIGANKRAACYFTADKHSAPNLVSANTYIRTNYHNVAARVLDGPILRELCESDKSRHTGRDTKGDGDTEPIGDHIIRKPSMSALHSMQARGAPLFPSFLRVTILPDKFRILC